MPEKIGSQLIQNGAFLRDGPWKNYIEGRYPVRGNHRHSVSEKVHISNFPSVESGLSGKFKTGG
jgi:hypothetical protein